MLTRLIAFAGGLAVSCFLLSFCGSDTPTGSHSSISAPAIREPAAGIAVTTSTPTLTVANATGAAGLRYRFEIGTDPGFATTVATGEDLPEGTSGTTSWTVSTPLNL